MFSMESGGFFLLFHKFGCTFGYFKTKIGTTLAEYFIGLFLCSAASAADVRDGSIILLPDKFGKSQRVPAKFGGMCQL